MINNIWIMTTINNSRESNPYNRIGYGFIYCLHLFVLHYISNSVAKGWDRILGKKVAFLKYWKILRFYYTEGNLSFTNEILTNKLEPELKHGAAYQKNVYLLATIHYHQRQKAPTVGVEPTTFGLEVQRASPLRHAGLLKIINKCLVME